MQAAAAFGAIVQTTHGLQTRAGSADEVLSQKSQTTPPRQAIYGDLVRRDTIAPRKPGTPLVQNSSPSATNEERQLSCPLDAVISACAPRPAFQPGSGDREWFARWPSAAAACNFFCYIFSSSIAVVSDAAPPPPTSGLSPWGVVVVFGSSYSPSDSLALLGFFSSIASSGRVSCRSPVVALGYFGMWCCVWVHPVASRLFLCLVTFVGMWSRGNWGVSRSRIHMSFVG
jgi:hypothetical protein